ncbi:kinase-like domain-containing protein [Cenococcum geophilum]
MTCYSTINRPNKGPQVDSIRDLHSLCGISNLETGAFKRSVFTFISDQDYVYFIASIPVEVDVYVKRPKLNIYDNWVHLGLLARLFLGEAETFKALIWKPHYRNIIRYYGCIVHRRYITEDRLREGVYSFNKILYIDSIKSGVEYLYFLRYAHNDLNLSNIIVGEDNTPIIINLGSYKRFNKDFITSERRYNEAALTKLWEWLEKK